MTILLLLLLVNPVLTPGAVRPLTKEQVCATKWGTDSRHVSKALKARVYAAYGIPVSERHLYIIDHLAPREIAGDDVFDNLWAELATEAKVKDRLENKLHALVCNGTIALDVAQHEIIKDWRAAYKKYLGDVLPSLPMDNLPNRRVPDAKPFGQVFLPDASGGVDTPDFPDGILGQLVPAAAHTADLASSGYCARYMSPGLSVECLVNGACVEPVCSRQVAGCGTAIGVSFPYRGHVFICQLGATCPRADRCIAASLPVPVDGVVFMGAEEEMVWSHTGWVVALVADQQAGWDLSIREQPRDAVGHHLSAESASLPECARDDSVASGVALCSPEPARVGLFDVCPEVGQRVYLLALPVAFVAAEPALITGMAHLDGSALLASYRDEHRSNYSAVAE